MSVRSEHVVCRELVADGSADAWVAHHLERCGACAAFAARVETVRRLAPQLAATPPPAGLDDRIVAAIREAPGPGGRRREITKRVARSAARPLMTAAAVAAVVLGIALPAGEGGASQAQLGNALLASAQETEALGTARLDLVGHADIDGGKDGLATSVAFGGTGELSAGRLRYRGTTRVQHGGRHASTLTPVEVTVIGEDVWSRRPDGTWVQVSRMDGPLAPLVLDAGSVLELLRLPKRAVQHLGDDAVGNTRARRLRFVVQPGPDLDYTVDAWVGVDDDVLRQLVIATTGATRRDGRVISWRSTTTVRLFGFGERVSIAAPADDAGEANVSVDGAAAVGFPFGAPPEE